MDALQAANEVRFARAQIKRDIKSGEIDPVDLLTGKYAAKHHAKIISAKLSKVVVVDFLQWVPYVGSAKAQRIINGVGLREGLTLEHLSPPRLALLVARLKNDLGRFTTYRAAQGARVGTPVVAAVAA